MKKILSIVFGLAFIVFCSGIILSSFSKSLDEKIENLYIEKQDALSLITGEPEKDKGNVWIDLSTRNNEIVVMGSSELSSEVSQNIKYEFPNEAYEGGFSGVGHAHVQNYIHAMNLGANYDSLKDNNIVLIESMQWFLGKDINADGFFSNFSEKQFYEFIQNEKISYKNKKYLSERFLELEKKSGNKNLYPQTHLLAKMCSSENVAYKVLYQLTKPYYMLDYKLMVLKDKYCTYRYFTSVDGKCEKKVASSAWKEQLNLASKEGQSKCTNNDLYVYDEYYTNELEPVWNELKDDMLDTKLESKEWKDYEFLLSLCDDLGLKPYIINVSCNGWYYDYRGLDKEKRQESYTRLSNIANEHDIDVYNGLVEKEYEPYVYTDVMHLGWKGWLYVSEAITDYFK